MFLEPPKIVSQAGDQEFNTWACGDISYSNDNRCNALKIATCFSLCGKASELSPGPSYVTDFAGPNHVTPRLVLRTLYWSWSKLCLSHIFLMLGIQLYLFRMICKLWRENFNYWLRSRLYLALAKVMVSQEKESSRVVIIPQEMDMGCIIKEEIHEPQVTMINRKTRGN